METNSDNNPQPTATVQRDTVEALTARLKAAEENPSVAKAHQTVNGTVASEAQKQPPSTPPAEIKTPPPEPNKDGLQQFKDKEGNVDPNRIQKANEHLERGIKEKEELLKRNRELLQKFTKASQEVSETKKQLGGIGAPTPIPEGGGRDFDQAFLERVSKLEEDPLVLRELIRQEARSLLVQENGEMRSMIEGMRQEGIYSQRASELDELIKAGHSWIATEGLGRFEKVFEEKPFLLQSPTPYMDALRFIDASSNGSASAPAQSRQPTPILGSGSAVPPPTSAPTVTKEQKMSDLSKQLHDAMKWHDRQGAARIMAEMTRLEQGR